MLDSSGWSESNCRHLTGHRVAPGLFTFNVSHRDRLTASGPGPEVSFRDRWSLMVIDGHRWLLMVIDGHFPFTDCESD